MSFRPLLVSVLGAAGPVLGSCFISLGLRGLWSLISGHLPVHPSVHLSIHPTELDGGHILSTRCAGRSRCEDVRDRQGSCRWSINVHLEELIRDLHPTSRLRHGELRQTGVRDWLRVTRELTARPGLPTTHPPFLPRHLSQSDEAPCGVKLRFIEAFE